MAAAFPVQTALEKALIRRRTSPVKRRMRSGWYLGSERMEAGSSSWYKGALCVSTTLQYNLPWYHTTVRLARVPDKAHTWAAGQFRTAQSTGRGIKDEKHACAVQLY